MHFAIRHTLPAIMLLISVFTILFYIGVTRPNQQAAAAQYAVERAADVVRNIQGRLNSDYAEDADVRIPNELFFAASKPETTGLYVFDSDNQIKYAYRRRYVGQSLADLPLFVDRVQLQTARDAGTLEFSDVNLQTGQITGYAGLARTLDGRVERLGLVYVLDYSRELQQLDQLSRRPTIFTIGLLVFTTLVLAALIRLYLDNRQTPLFNALKKLADGEPLEAGTFTGDDEFSEIGAGLAGASQLLREYRTRLAATEEALNRTSRARSLLLNELSKDLRPQATSVAGYFELLQDLNLEDEAQAHVQQGQVAAKSLLAIAGELLEIEKLTLNPTRYRPEPVTPTLLFQSVVDSILPLAKAQGRPFSLSNGGGDTAPLMADPLVLKGFILHALKKFLPLSARDGCILTYTGNESDDGAGILDVRITGRFLPDGMRPLEAIKSSDASTGMNKSSYDISDRLSDLLAPELIDLVEKNGAALSLYAGAEDAEDELRVRLVDRDLPEEVNYAHLMDSLPPQAGVAIMVIEPDAGNRSLCQDILLKAGHQVTVCASMKEAQYTIQDAAIYSGYALPSLMLISLDGPAHAPEDTVEASYKELCEINPQIRNVPIVALTSHWDRESSDYADLVIAALVKKPFTTVELNGAVEQVSRMMFTKSED